MNTLYAKAIPTITSCVMGELEKLGPRVRITWMRTFPFTNTSSRSEISLFGTGLLTRQSVAHVFSTNEFLVNEMLIRMFSIVLHFV